ncbi:hypothetical protein RYA05_03380 [Pseudomonas syringae pv. actinidiae]|nr:hypothetical protein [Pseudomonas syringae pv. actinidiae]
MNHNKQTYEATFKAIGQVTVVQRVEGIDLRDAASRFFTSDQGMALAKEHHISADIIHEFPGNFDSHITVSENYWSLQVALVKQDS